ncbi:class II fructose-bisphosphate aldolase [Streptomyces sp. SID3343]|uniref:class II fructose-bisphosphate aldolase n=1 Tax=Streptomyces sp. SID3343 TaxID=2690260 RepID=UPI00136F127E|nr:class II fructose-bisphosphate aldolase [Streptomyces sp. SID3343]MYW01586.1 fructose-bisphosphate aldolase [Streptomyces sp. SID3343]
MPLTTTAELTDAARAVGVGTAAFNVITLEHAEAVIMAAEAAELPVVVAISENAVRFRRGRLGPLAAACRVLAEESVVPVALHLDHVESFDLLVAAEGTGISSVMFDASRLPYAANVAATAEAVVWAHARGITLEAELGQVGGKPGQPALDAHAPGARTDPDEAAAYVGATGVDALAVAVGSSHAMLDRTATLDHDLIARLRAAVEVPLVLHGSSGVPDDELRRAVAAGMTKINVGTALNIAYTGTLRDRLAADPGKADPRPALASAREATVETVGQLLRLIAGRG